MAAQGIGCAVLSVVISVLCEDPTHVFCFPTRAEREDIYSGTTLRTEETQLQKLLFMPGL